MRGRRLQALYLALCIGKIGLNCSHSFLILTFGMFSKVVWLYLFWTNCHKVCRIKIFLVKIYLVTFFEKLLLKSYYEGERLPALHPLHSYFIPKPSAFIGRMVVTNIWEFAIMTMIFVNWAANLWIFFNFLEIEDQQYVEQLLTVLLFHNCKRDIFLIPQSDFAESTVI